MASRKAMILGSTGQVGVELQRSFAGYGEVLAYDRSQADLTRPGAIIETIRQQKPSVVLLAAAYTAVDKAESEPELAMAVNAEAPGLLAQACAESDILFVTYSTDYVFDGSKREPWVESDEPRPLNMYGRSKLEGERRVQQAGGRHLIFRTSWVYGPHGKNFFLTMLRLGKEREELSIVADQTGSPTSSIAIAAATRTVVDRMEGLSSAEAAARSGIYHMTCAGSTNWYEFARHIFSECADQLEGRQPRLRPLKAEDYPTPAKRPSYSVMSNEMLSNAWDVRLPAWQDAFATVKNRLQAPLS
ncbi:MULTISPECIES: dTDP-4-dehydrorhamnose reductase [Acidobacterium]|uniref:dTDP-4-dehydrorhamnose reductase n=1 Tax=Acidobacterium capsulatum (strain ATCC 51196 / DSM 11244 / BCRC 80197 / JCM 7670 / NBRC 15755 / NCIMB 13165 / 161) TaxID=240015 RepID=C1F860_ACIC5|nr:MULTISPECIES: dTDP-4-dehydrorhamnose reductase [Acidobacterium]ACO32671.1 dTDP-4-dehydrorhamnose reductase [Acidobacterium capsulatum ATCC 51196]HCT59748.1 dTDP-4-dehydrorhamnose reductase [Acidobacterium sp.]